MLRVGVLGIGRPDASSSRRGTSLLRQLRAFPGVQVTAVCDLEAEALERTQREFEVPDAFTGIDDLLRSDVEALVTALRPAFIRWPGGNVAQDYHWEWGVGPRAQRPVWINLSWSNEPEPGDIGTDEFIAFCRRVGTEPTITVNVEGRGATAEEAAAWVEYANGPATSKYGAMRAATATAPGL